MKQLIFILSVLFILAVSIGRYSHLKKTAEDGVSLLVPIYVHKIETASLPHTVHFRYHNIIPADQVSEKDSAIIVQRRPSGRARYVRPYAAKEPLRPREHLLKYHIVHEGGLSQKTDRSKIKFAADIYVLRQEKHSEAFTSPKSLAIKYAILKVNEKGEALLAGLTDGNGVVLSKQY